ncbi:MAG: thioesterase domain-containing protein [Bryobacteraceae bacterium]
MRILLAHNSPYYPSHGGGDKSNRLLMEALAARRHACRVIARTGAASAEEHDKLLRQLAERNVPVDSDQAGVVQFRLKGVEVHTAAANPNLRGYFAAQLRTFTPDITLASTDDPAQLMLSAALKSDATRVVYLARATLALPFGPDCAFPSESRTAAIRAADGVAGVSQYVADYIKRWSGIEAVSLPISLMEPEPCSILGRIANDFVTIVNPCAVKGIAIFLALADRMPDVKFAAVPTWGTIAEDLAAMRQRPNITVLEPADNIDVILARTRVLLVPSVWAEARSRIIVEAMMRGVPVMAANVGGIPEAMMGLDYLLPVLPIEKYRPQVDQQMVPIAEVPEQDVGPWQAALAELLSDRNRYEKLANLSRVTALMYVGGVSVGPFEQFLQKLLLVPRRERPVAAADRLSPEKQRLLALRMKKRASGAWFPRLDADSGAAMRLFCFAHAGSGPAAFRAWPKRLPAEIAVAPVCPPGRETRLVEPPFTEMSPLVEALGEAIAPQLRTRFAFFGHSMGAAVAFELARWLRRHGHPQPAALIVSAARAPQFRRGHVPGPDPADAELLDQLRRLGAVDETIALVWPALRADTQLYRRYTYTDDAPLDCPIHAFGGNDDPNVQPEHLEAWRQQTRADFTLRIFPGGHFFLRDREVDFLDALAKTMWPGSIPRDLQNSR